MVQALKAVQTINNATRFAGVQTPTRVSNGAGSNTGNGFDYNLISQVFKRFQWGQEIVNLL